jgi:hypothetical protein
VWREFGAPVLREPAVDEPEQVERLADDLVA